MVRIEASRLVWHTLSYPIFTTVSGWNLRFFCYYSKVLVFFPCLHVHRHSLTNAHAHTGTLYRTHMQELCLVFNMIASICVNCKRLQYFDIIFQAIFFSNAFSEMHWLWLISDLEISGKCQGWYLTELQKYMDIHMIYAVMKLFLYM